MRYLITGSAGFIGFHLCRRLLDGGNEVLGCDNLNSYYDVNLKLHRQKKLVKYDGFRAVKTDLLERKELDDLFRRFRPQVVCHLAAQVGIHYSFENPEAYAGSNLMGFFNVLEMARIHRVGRFVYASSSSVYGGSGRIPFDENQRVESPVSVYAATKKSNELLAHAYAHLFGIQCIGLRFFTAYGPWGRPDMAIWLFTKAILEGKPIRIFNFGKQRRDFTFINDIINGVEKALTIELQERYEIFNLGSGKTVSLLELVESLERLLQRPAIKELLPPRPGDIEETLADITRATRCLGYIPSTDLETGLKAFVDWYSRYRETGE